MFRPSTVLFLVCLCVALPCARVTAAPAVSGTILGPVAHATYSHHRYGYFGHVRPYARYYRHYAPQYHAPYPHQHRHQPPSPRHQPYFSMHGYWGPAWRAPNTLRFYDR